MHDFHTHFIPSDVLEWLKENKNKVNARWSVNEETNEESLIINEKCRIELKKNLINFEAFIQGQENAGVRHTTISPIPQLFLYDSVSISTEISKIYNEALAQLTVNHPEKISALGTVPLANPVKAAQVLNDAMKLGLKGAIIGPGLGKQMLTDPFFKAFFEEANRLKAILFIHPLVNDDPRLKRRMMPNLIGEPWETTVCATDLVLSGFADKYPDVKIVFAHGGGFLPYQIGRLDKGYEQWEVVSANLQAPPSEYLKRFWYDSVVGSQESIDFLIKVVGEDRVVPGSDANTTLWESALNISDKGIQSLLAESVNIK
ncbi:amidohydrolase family protein [Niallia endozanthoxylica]|uniref:Amidohydrolase n=1 Tax=Niallia endozanthoxylica TaxID=2036016 RepID=A0A5J5HLS3_9BACI|nr:amidohydrolase family protein [Niallia endozanthoxylica]KAA9021651.1 amidohydrolase [Niallia endozanthoxylica]